MSETTERWPGCSVNDYGYCGVHDHWPASEEGDPRAVALAAVRNMPFDWYCPTDDRRPRVSCRECIAAVALDAYEAAGRIEHGITS